MQILPDDLPLGAAGTVSALARDYGDGFQVLPHTHPWSQLIHAISGVMRVSTSQGTWILPPHRALWVPPGVQHGLRMVGAVKMRTLYITPEASLPPQAVCKIVMVSGLLRELILAAIAGGTEERIAHVQALVLDELRHLDAQPLHLPLPREGRLKKICDALLADPGRGESLEDWADLVGVSSRTLARLFQKDLGMRFVDWRQQARLAEALSRLASGVPVSSVAHALGYDSPAAFSAMFRRTLGSAPRDCLPG